MESNIWRTVIKETDKAYLVQVSVYNRRDGSSLKQRWVPKSVCGDVKEVPGFEKFVQVPEWALPSGQW